METLLKGPRCNLEKTDKGYRLVFWGLPEEPKNYVKLGDALEEFNKRNLTNYKPEDIGKVDPNPYVDEWVPSATSDKVYHVYGLLKSLYCECTGFSYRRDCWHVQAVRDYYKERIENAKTP